MRATILFFLIASILILSGWIWSTSTEIRDPFSIKTHKDTMEQVGKIRKLSDVVVLQNEAIQMLMSNERKAVEHERVLSKIVTFVVLIFLLAFVSLIITFLEIAARGKARQQ